MKILYLIKQELDETAKKIIEEHKNAHEVAIIDIKENKNYDQIVDLIANSNKVISW